MPWILPPGIHFPVMGRRCWKLQPSASTRVGVPHGLLIFKFITRWKMEYKMNAKMIKAELSYWELEIEALKIEIHGSSHWETRDQLMNRMGWFKDRIAELQEMLADAERMLGT